MTLPCTSADQPKTHGYGKFHIIYQTETTDYCREDCPSSITTVDAAKDWANRYYAQTGGATKNPAVKSFRVEWW